MIRTAIVCAGLFLAQGDSHANCVLNSARGVDDLLDSATYIWAAIQRCQKPGAAAPNDHGNPILCTMDVSAAVEAANSMIVVVLKGIEQCGELKEALGDSSCGMAAGELTRTIAGVSSSSAGVTAKCPNGLNGNKGLDFLVKQPGKTDGKSALASAAQQASFGECLVDVKDVTMSLFKALQRLTTIKENCDGDDEEDCAHNSLKVVAAFAAMGEYLAGAVGRCSKDIAGNDGLKEGSECGKEVVGLVRHLDRLASAGLDLSKECKGGEERLFALGRGGKVETQSSSSSSLTLALAAFIPITAVFGFVGGKRFAKSQQDFIPLQGDAAECVPLQQEMPAE